MPIHDFRCAFGHTTERFVAQGVQYIQCPECKRAAEKIFLQPPMGFVQADICYDSPVDGRPITTKQARIEDLRRNGCVEWDSGMREEVVQKREQRDMALERNIENTVEAELAKMPARKKELLAQEVRAGASVEVVRATPGT